MSYSCFNCGEHLEYSQTIDSVNEDIYGKREIVECDCYKCPACDTEYLVVPSPNGQFVNLLELDADSEGE